jgi:hypothetical protein
MESTTVTELVLRTADYDAFTHVEASDAAKLLLAGKASRDARTAEFDVSFGAGFPTEAKKAFQSGVDVWSVLLSTSVTIRVTATWTDLDADVLGSAKPTQLYKNFAHAPQRDTWYPVALANKLAGIDLFSNGPDVEAKFNKSFATWYYGTDGKPPAGKTDFMTVVLHEIGHALGFSKTANVKDGSGSWGNQGIPTVWDRLIKNAAGKSVIDTTSFANPSKDLATQLQSANLFFNGTRAKTANGGMAVRIYAPTTWESGSSFSHLDESTFPAGNANSLMTPRLGRAEAIHDPGAICKAILTDLGW